jgi:hypothetical protein
MRRPIIAVAVAALILAATMAVGLGISACGSSTTAATTQAAATGAPGGGQAPDMSAAFTTALDPLVKAGTITSDQESTVLAALSSSMPGGQGGRAPSSGATPPGGSMPSAGATPPSGAQGGMQGPGKMFSSTLAKLVSDGTITSAQKTAISTALSSAMQGGPGRQGGTTSQTGTPSSTSATQTQT